MDWKELFVLELGMGIQSMHKATGALKPAKATTKPKVSSVAFSHLSASANKPKQGMMKRSSVPFAHLKG